MTHKRRPTLKIAEGGRSRRDGGQLVICDTSLYDTITLAVSKVDNVKY